MRRCVDCGTSLRNPHALRCKPCHGAKRRYDNEPDSYIVDEASGCWIWQRGIIGRYAAMYDPRTKRNGYGHRLMYERRFGPIPDGMEIDHACPHGPNPLCVNPEHLRTATSSQNKMNRRTNPGGTSRFKGVTFRATRGTFRARIKVNGRERCLGSFRDERLAAEAYDQAAREVFGEFAVLNFPEAPR